MWVLNSKIIASLQSIMNRWDLTRLKISHFTGYRINLELILKFFLFVFKSLQNQCPQYLSEWHHPPTQSRSLRSGDFNLLSIPRTRL